MITLNEIAYNIKNLAYGGKNSLENNISTSQIKHWVHYHRAKLIADNINNGILNFTSLYQILSDSSLHKVTTKEGGKYINNVNFYGTNTLRKNSKQNKGDFRNTGYLTYYIPETIMLPHDAAIKEISVSRTLRDVSTGGYSDYSSQLKIYRKSQSERAYGDFNRFTDNDHPFYVIERNSDNDDSTVFFMGGGYSVSEGGKIRFRIFGLQDSPNYYGDLHTPGGRNLEYRYKAACLAIFQNPTEIRGFDDATSSYPIPAQYVGDLVQRVLQTEVQVELKTRADEMVDGADDNMKMRASGS